MSIEKLFLNNFRLFDKQEFSFSPRSTLIFGRNGSGKTTALEALHLMASGRSVSQNRNRSLVREGGEFFTIGALLNGESGPRELLMSYGEQLKFFLNGKESSLNKAREFYSTLFFSSTSFNLYLSSRVYLRRLFDSLSAGIFNLYINSLLEYNKVLKQKNSLLKRECSETREFESWNKLLAINGIKLIKWRKLFVKMVQEEMNEIIEKDRLHGADSIALEYLGTIDENRCSEENSLLELLNRAIPRERSAQRALYGPHRDSYRIDVNGKPILFYSTGERKKYLLLVYYAYLNLFSKKRGFAPVFLFDDFDAAMDMENLAFLWDKHPAVQTIATSVRSYPFFEESVALGGAAKEGD